jgi:hypothetical protein
MAEQLLECTPTSDPRRRPGSSPRQRLGLPHDAGSDHQHDASQPPGVVQDHGALVALCSMKLTTKPRFTTSAGTQGWPGKKAVFHPSARTPRARSRLTSSPRPQPKSNEGGGGVAPRRRHVCRRHALDEVGPRRFLPALGPGQRDQAYQTGREVQEPPEIKPNQRHMPPINPASPGREIRANRARLCPLSAANVALPVPT